MNYQIEMTNICNARCIGCPNRLQDRKRGVMMPENFYVALQKIAKVSSKNARIALHGNGEPLISPYFFDCLDVAKHMGFTNIDFSTNGIILRKDIFERLKNYGGVISWMRVSVNTVNRLLFDKINGGADYERVLNNTQDLIDSNQPFEIVLQLMRTKGNIGETEADFRRELIGKYSIKETPYTTFSNQVEENGLNNDDHRTCPYGNDFVNIHYDGDMNGCCIDATKEQLSGNILHDDIFNAKFVEYNKQSKQGDFSNLPICRKCRNL